MDRELSSEEMRSMRRKRIYRIIVIVIMMIIAVFGIRQLLGKRIERQSLIVSEAVLGIMEGSITASGTVIPAYEQTLSSPFLSRIDSVYLQAGDAVKIGDRLLKLSVGNKELQLDRVLDEFALMQNDKLQLQLQKGQKQLELETNQQIMELKVATFENELEIQLRLFDLGGGMQSNVDRAQLNLDIGRLELQQIEQRITNEEQLLETELSGLVLRMSIKQNEMVHLRRELQMADMRSEFEGVVTWVNDTPGAAVNQGESLARIADLSSFKLRGAVSDYYAEKLTVSNPVYLKINGERLDGTVLSIEPTVTNNIITFYAVLDQKESSLLRSNMRVDISIITSTRDGVVRIKTGAAINGHGFMPLFIDNGSWAERRMVKVGETSLDYAELLSGVKPGEKVIISRTQDFENLKRIKIVE